MVDAFLAAATGVTAANATMRLYVAQGSNVVQTLSGPIVAYVPCNLTIEATDPAGAEGSDAFIVRRVDSSGACAARIERRLIRG